MPLNRDRSRLGKMDLQIYIHQASIGRSDTGGPVNTTTQRGPYWASMEYLARKQMETEVATRITSFQQIKFVMRYDTTVEGYLSKAAHITVKDNPITQEFNIISVTKDAGRKQFLEIIAELKE